MDLGFVVEVLDYMIGIQIPPKAHLLFILVLGSLSKPLLSRMLLISAKYINHAFKLIKGILKSILM